MALLYYRQRGELVDDQADIRLISDPDYRVAITFHTDEDDEDSVTEVLLSEDEVRQAYDVLFNG